MNIFGNRGDDSLQGLPSYLEQQRLWAAVSTHPWKSLALVPCDAEVESEFLGEALVTAGRQYGSSPIEHIAAGSAMGSELQRLLASVHDMTQRGDCVVISTGSVTTSPATMQIVSATSGALVVVRMNKSRLSSVKETIDTIGRDRVLGSVVLG